MSIFKRGSTWWIDFTTPRGKRIRCSAQTEKREEAQELHDKLKNEAWRTSRLRERPRYTWDEAAVRWLDEKSGLASIPDVMSMLRWLQPYMRGRFLDEIDRDFIETIAKERKKDVSEARTNRYLELIRKMLRCAVTWNWLEQAPVVRTYKENSRRIRWITKSEASRLLSLLPPHQAAIAEFALLTGLRQRNVLELEWPQVDLTRRAVWIHADQAKSGKAIGVPLSEAAIEIVRRQIGKHDRRVFTFKGHPVRQVNTKAWHTALKKAGIKDFRWHDLRHTWASWHIQAGTPIHVLQELGGWESFEMVRRYAHLSPDHLAPYADRVGFGTNTAQQDLRLMK